MEFSAKLLSKDFVEVLSKLKSKIDNINNQEVVINKRKKYLMLLDVETIGVADKSCYDISYVIVDMQGNIQKIRAFCVRELFTQTRVMREAYYWNKFGKYLELINEGIYEIEDLNTIIQTMNDDIKNFNVKILTAYNSLFDVGSIFHTIQKYNGISFDYNKVKHECLWEQATNTLMNKKDYRKFAKENDLKTASGKYWSSTAESCYKYLTKNLELNEEHIGLYDVIFHELEILKTCNSKHCKREATPCSQTWRKMKILMDEME